MILPELVRLGITAPRNIPVNGSEPAPILKRYWLEGNPSLLSKYLKKSNRLPEKPVTGLEATKLYTFVEPFIPENSFQLTPSMVVVAIGEPVLEMGPAPPSAASQIITSYSLEPVDEEDVNMSYATSATMLEPE